MHVQFLLYICGEFEKNVMRYKLTIILLLMFLLPVKAYEPVEHENVLKVKYGFMSQVDPYLSPLVFHGQQIGLGNEWWQSFRKDSVHWAHVGRFDINGLRAYNTAYSNMIYGLGIYAGWGAYYKWSFLDGRLSVHLGPYLEANFMVREISSNVNKPFSFDAGIDVVAMTGISWSFYGKKTSYRLRYLLRTNLIGVDYMPDYWESYYEITESVRGDARCSGHWNHNMIRHELTLDFQFPHSTWRLGAEHIFLDYRTKYMEYKQHQINIVVGCIWKYKIRPNAKL